ncbi:MAG: hypothetical protein U1C33_01025, partial [Candidatus Cloacimonadaceae bacterium]|nr:hypothetical protein [Candidatus Cloacimonadaceae bacterium]
MKRSFKTKYHVLIIILFVIVTFQSVILLFASEHATSLKQLTGDIQSIVIVFLFIIFIYLLVIFNYIPFRLNKLVKEFQSIVDEISDGNYSLQIDPSLYDGDGSVQNLVMAMTRMVNIIVRFDQLKAEKIFEHNQRITQLINLLPQMVIILSANGEVIYLNDSFRKSFPAIQDNMNLSEMIIKDEFHQKVFNLIIDALRNGSNVYEELVKDRANSAEFRINGSLVRNRKGNS